METKDPIAEADDDVVYWTGAIARAEAVLKDIRDSYLDSAYERRSETAASVAVEKVRLEAANKSYLCVAGDDDNHREPAARKKVEDAACGLTWAQDEAKAADRAHAALVVLEDHVVALTRRLREDLAKAKEIHAGALTAHDKLQAAIVQELEALSPGFVKGEVPIAKLWEATLAAGHVGFVHRGKTPDGAEYRYTKAKASLVEAGRMTEAKGFCVLRVAGAKARVLALLD
jgi:hypothetical protein